MILRRRSRLRCDGSPGTAERRPGPGAVASGPGRGSSSGLRGSGCRFVVSGCVAFDPAVAARWCPVGAEELGEGVRLRAGEAFGDGVGGVAVAEFLRECFGHSGMTSGRLATSAMFVMSYYNAFKVTLEPDRSYL